jgi:alcohol dehydrogenase class IV
MRATAPAIDPETLMALINYIVPVEFDFGAVKTLPAECSALGMSRVLLVTDKGLRAAGLVDRIVGLLKPAIDIDVFDEVPTNPTEAATLAAAERYKATDRDGIVALGGGSPLDLAKAAALMASHPGPMAQYAYILGGLAKITSAAPPVIAIPTTAGTGSEVGRGALITLADTRKLAFSSLNIAPKKAINDPELTLGLPPVLTAATGMDALTHCVECFIAPKINPPADAIALDGAERAWKWIEKATSEPGNRDARWHMMMASMHGALSFQKGLGAVHAMSHPLGGISEVSLHHGTLNAVILPAVLRFNADHVGEKYATLKRVFGLPAGADLPDAVAALSARLGLPPNLKAMGVPKSVFPRMVEGAMVEHSTPSNPRPPTAADYAQLFEDCWE